MIFQFEPNKKDHFQFSYEKLPARLQIRWFLVECLGKFSFAFSQVFRQSVMFAVGKNFNATSSVQQTFEGSVVLWQNASPLRGSLNEY